MTELAGRNGTSDAAQQQGAASDGAGHPLGNPITAEDCASERAANITGVLLPVDGGHVAR